MKDSLVEIKRVITSNIGQVEKRLRNFPHGSLQASKIRGKHRYYYVPEAKGERRYLRKENLELAKKLAQRDYDKNVIEDMKTVIECIDTITSIMGEHYDSIGRIGLCKGRDSLITPVMMTDEEYASWWQAKEYVTKGNIQGSELKTERGEYVRSKSEKIIADKLYRNGVPYRYEERISLNGLGYVHPDFTVLNVRTREAFYWEHFGMLDNPEYAAGAERKLAAYEKSGYLLCDNLIVTRETGARVLDMSVVDAIIERKLV